MHAISNEEITQILQAGIPDSKIDVVGDGYQYQVSIISDSFAGKSTVQRHKLVYTLLNQPIAEGRLHALSLITRTPDESS
jgi:acid stress-induced BolA-like protein IbaG/YrbA